MNLIYQDNNVFIKKRYSTIKIVDEAKTAADKQGDSPKNRTIYSKVFLTYSGMIINPLSDVRLLPITNKKSSLSNVNAFIEVPGGTDLIYEPQMDKNNEFNYCALNETGSNELLVNNNNEPLPLFASFGFFPRTLNSENYDYQNWIQSQTTRLNGDGEALDVLIFGQEPGPKNREIAEVVQVRVLSCVVGREGTQQNTKFKAVCVAIANGDLRFEGINSMEQWKNERDAVGDNNTSPKLTLKQSYDFCVGFLNQLFNLNEGQNVVFQNMTNTQKLVQLQINNFVKENN